MKRVFLIAALVACAVVAWAGKGEGGKPPKDPSPTADPAIAYNKYGYQSWKLMVANVDGSNQTVLAQADRLGQMSWSHDNSQLCYTRTVEDLPHQYVGYRLWGIYRINVDGTGETLVYEFPDADALPFSGSPDWSPTPAGDDQYKIAFQHQVQEPDGTYTSDIFLVNPDGTGLTNLTNSPTVTETKPCWSRDGRKLTVVVNTGIPGANRELHVLELTADGLAISGSYRPSKPTGGPWYGVISARWGKTQDKLVISKDRPGNEMPDLWVMDLANPASPLTTQITDTPDFEEGAADWSEDDTMFVFWGGSVRDPRSRWNDMGAWIMPADGAAAPDPILPDAQDAVRWRR